MSRVTPDVMPNQTDYKARDEYSPKYRFMKIPLNNLTGSTITITPTAGQLLEFKLPIGVFNLARSYLLEDESAGSTANNFNWHWEDVLEVAQNVYFGTAGGLGICDLQYANNYSKIVRPAKTKFSKFLSHDVQSSLYPSCMLGGSAGGGVADNLFPVSYVPLVTNIYAIPGGTNPTFNALAPYFEPQHLWAGGSAVASYRPRQIKLGDYIDTIFAVDKDLYFPQEMYVRLQTSPGSKMAFISTSDTDPTAGVALPANITLSNIYLYLAIEQNQIIANSVIDKVRSGGMKIQIPYTTAFRNPHASTGIAFQIQLSRQYGKRLKKMLWAVFNGANAETLNTAYDNTNWNASKITSYQTYLDNRPLQDFQLACAQPSATTNVAINSDDWRENARFLEGSVIYNMAQYQMNWHHHDYFYEPKDVQLVPDENIDEGLDMDSVHLWQVQASAPNANAMVSYNWATFIRDLHIHPSGAPSME